MIVLDTNVISEVAKASPDPNVADWLRRREPLELYLCTPVVAELSYGGHRIRIRDKSSRFLDGLATLLEREFKNRVLPFDQGAALVQGELRAARNAVGRPVSIVDSMIAAICKIHGARLATRNLRDFEMLDIELVDPFVAAD